jgi:hypothetical protein
MQSMSRAISEVRASPPAPRFADVYLANCGILMDLNRHQFLFIGLFVLLIGLQFRYVSAYHLTPQATKFLAERTGQGTPAGYSLFSMTGAPAPQEVLNPPDWLSWCLISAGAVLALHSLAMPRPT